MSLVVQIRRDSKSTEIEAFASSVKEGEKEGRKTLVITFDGQANVDKLKDLHTAQTMDLLVVDDTREKTVHEKVDIIGKVTKRNSTPEPGGLVRVDTWVELTFNIGAIQ